MAHLNMLTLRTFLFLALTIRGSAPRNQFLWENLGTDVSGGLPYRGMHAFWKGLIAMRKVRGE